MKTNKKRFLVVGDLHTKYDVFLNATKEFEEGNFDKIVFLGDYCDDWQASPYASLNLLTSLIDFKKQYNDRCILLLGNHDLSQWMGNEFACSGFNQTTHIFVSPFFRENENLFQIAYSYKDYLFTHAGVCSSWLRDISLLSERFKNLKTAKEISEHLNLSLSEMSKDKEYWSLFKALTQCGFYRGGFEHPSPIWADKQELISNPCPKINQIVGHTPVNTLTIHKIRNGDKSDSYIFFCDTCSKRVDGKDIGDRSFLRIYL